jgi:hypothetical protein
MMKIKKLMGKSFNCQGAYKLYVLKWIIIFKMLNRMTELNLPRTQLKNGAFTWFSFELALCYAV